MLEQAYIAIHVGSGKSQIHRSQNSDFVHYFDSRHVTCFLNLYNGEAIT